MLCLAVATDAEKAQAYALFWWALAVMAVLLLAGFIMVRILRWHWAKRYEAYRTAPRGAGEAPDPWTESARRVQVDPSDDDDEPDVRPSG